MDNKLNFIKKILSKDIKGVLALLEQMLSSSIDIKRLTFDIIDILKDVIIYKNTQDSNILFVLSKKDVEDIVPYIAIEEAFTMIDELIEASSHYAQSLNAKIYFELAMLKICNQVKEEQVMQRVAVDQPAILQVKQEPIKLEVPIIEEKIEEPKEEIIETIVEEIPIIEEPIEEPSLIISEEETQEDLPEEIVEDINDVLENEIKEEIEESTNSKEDTEVSFNDILNILVQAERTVLQEIKEKWDFIAKYRYNLNTAKLASMLYDGIPVAACKKGIIIAFDHQPQVNEVNVNDNYHHLKNFLKEVLGESYDFIGVKTSDWLAIRGKFIDLKNRGELPKAKIITLQHIQEYKEPVKQLTEAQQFAIDMFGEDIVEIEE